MATVFQRETLGASFGVRERFMTWRSRCAVRGTYGLPEQERCGYV